jgi:hypothetical protein
MPQIALSYYTRKTKISLIEEKKSHRRPPKGYWFYTLLGVSG